MKLFYIYFFCVAKRDTVVHSLNHFNNKKLSFNSLVTSRNKSFIALASADPESTNFDDIREDNTTQLDENNNKDGLEEMLAVDDRSAFYTEVGLKSYLEEIDKKIKERNAKKDDVRKKRFEAMKLRDELRANSRQRAKNISDMRGQHENNRTETKNRQKIPLPLFRTEFGLLGNWIETGGNYLLKPKEGVPVKGVIHFLGGAFVGATPHIAYRYLLNGLSEVGFVIVATPFSLEFDYLKVCDNVLESFEKAAVPLAEEFGALPVIGLGHSCGALLQLLITCLFPDTPRAANALISFNNKPVKDAIPAFEEAVLPLVQQIFTNESTSIQLIESLWNTRSFFFDNLEAAARTEVAPLTIETEILPLLKQASAFVDQFPPLLKQVADGSREFTPTPDEVQEVVKRMYRARRTLVVRFENDSLDESEEVRKVIKAGMTLLRMRRPMIDMDLRYETLSGTHITPLTQDIFSIPTTLKPREQDDSCPLKQARKDFLVSINTLGQVLVEWLEEGLSPGQFNPQ